jgi:glycerol-3-phosphate cytidylyltransferase
MIRKTAITYGTFDLFHIGHLRLFKRIKEFADYLIVGVSTDEFNLEKGKKSIIPFENRIEIIKNIKCVDQVIPEANWNQKIDDIKKFKIDYFVMGEDWEGKFDFLSKYCKVIYLPRTVGISSSSLKNSLMKIKNIKLESLNEAINLLIQVKDQLS